MNPFGRTVLAYHGCPAAKRSECGFLRGLLNGTERIADWRFSENAWD